MSIAIDGVMYYKVGFSVNYEAPMMEYKVEGIMVVIYYEDG